MLGDTPRLKFQLHQSALTMAAQCGEKFRRRIILREPYPTPPYVVVGSGVDQSVRANLASRISQGEQLSLGAALEAARDGVVAGMRQEIHLSEEDAQKGLKRVQGEAVDKAVRLASLHHGTVAPTIKPQSVARRWVLDVRGYDFELAGEWDIEEQDLGIRDTKTSEKKPSEDTADNSTQLTMYALAHYRLQRVIPKRLALDYLIDYKQGPVVVTLQTARDVASFRPFLERVQMTVESIRAGRFVPADPGVPGVWWCSKRYCGYWGTCRFAARPVMARPLVGIRGTQ